MPLPLSSLLVVSLEQAVAAPLCTCRLADAGARVIKIERPQGDFARFYDDAMDDPAPRAARVVEFIDRYLPEAETLLELGCGTGSRRTTVRARGRPEACSNTMP